MSRFSDYYSRDVSGIEKVLFRAQRPLQSAELNDLQSVIFGKMSGISNAVLTSGQVVSGGAISMLSGAAAAKGNCQVGTGKVFFNGAVYTVNQLTMSIPVDTTVAVGVRYLAVEQDEFDNQDYLDPAVGSANYQEGGAGRSVAKVSWGWASTDGRTDTNSAWQFFPVYQVVNGVVSAATSTPPAIAAPYVDLLARYDKEAHGSYVTTRDGLKVYFAGTNSVAVTVTAASSYVTVGATAGVAVGMILRTPMPNSITIGTVSMVDAASNTVTLSAPSTINYKGVGVFVDPANTYIYKVAAGTADINGYKVDKKTDSSVLVNQDPNTLAIRFEPHTFVPDINGKYQMWTNRAPIAQITSLSGVKQKSVTVTKGPIRTTDNNVIPDASVLSVVSVRQNATTYLAGRDFTVVGTSINWATTSTGNIAPAPGSSYTITYTYLTQVTPDSVGLGYVTVSGLVPGSQVTIDYTYKIPRMDLMVLNQDGSLSVLKGIPQLRNPYPPTPSASQLALATLYVDWINDPVVTNVAPRTASMADIETMRKSIVDLYALVASQQLSNNANNTPTAEKLGVFVDAFSDNSNRDAGQTQTASIVNGVLILPITPTANDGSNADALSKIATLPFVLEPILEQPSMTESLQVNPYQAFTPVPAKVELNPSVDNWVIYTDIWKAGTTTRLMTGSWPHPNGRVSVSVSSSVSTEVVDTKQLPYIQSRVVNFTIRGFYPGEKLTQILFDTADIV
jgi:hypothetical protein